MNKYNKRVDLNFELLTQEEINDFLEEIYISESVTPELNRMLLDTFPGRSIISAWVRSGFDDRIFTTLGVRASIIESIKKPFFESDCFSNLISSTDRNE